MAPFHELLTRRFPEPSIESIQRFKREFPSAPAELIEFFRLVRGGQFRQTWLTGMDENWIDRFYAIGVSIKRSDVFSAHGSVKDFFDGWPTWNLFSFGKVDELIPIGESMTGMFLFCCRDHSIIYREIGGDYSAHTHAESLDAFVASLRSKPLIEYDGYENEIANHLLMCEDERVLGADFATLRAICESPHEDSILHIAAGFDCFRVLKSLIERGFDPLETNAVEDTALHKAAKNDAMDCLRYLTTHMKNHLELRNAEGESPLVAACERQIPATRAVIWLIHAGANTQVKIGDLAFEDWLLDRNRSHRDSYTIPIIEYLKSGKADDF